MHGSIILNSRRAIRDNRYYFKKTSGTQVPDHRPSKIQKLRPPASDTAVLDLVVHAPLPQARPSQSRQMPTLAAVLQQARQRAPVEAGIHRLKQFV